MPLLLSLLLFLEEREQDDVADGGGTGEHHDQAIDADADAASGWHAVFEGLDEVVVDLLLFFAAGLVFEAGFLDVGVVELGVAGADFLAVDDEFVNFDGLAARRDLRERDELAGDAGDEAGIEGVFLDLLFEDLLDDFVVFHVFRKLDAEFVALGAALLGGDVEEVVTGDAFDEVVVVGALPWAGEIDGAEHFPVLVFVLDLQAAAEFLGEEAGHFFDKLGHDFEVGEGLVGFEHRELRIVTARDAFVTEVTVEFEKLGETTDEQPFQEKLRSDAHGERHAEGVVMRLEGACGGPTGDALKHRGFDFEVAAGVEEVADRSDHLRTRDEDRGAFLVRHEVEVALAVFQFAVSDAVPLVGHRAEGFGKDGEFFDFNRRFAGAGHEGFAFDAEPVATVEAVKDRELVFGELLDGDEALDISEHIGDVEEAGLAHVAQTGNAAGDFHLHAFFKSGAQIGGGVGGFEGLTEGVDAEFAELGEFVAANGDEFGFRGVWGLGCRFGVGHARKRPETGGQMPEKRVL